MHLTGLPTSINPHLLEGVILLLTDVEPLSLGGAGRGVPVWLWLGGRPGVRVELGVGDPLGVLVPVGVPEGAR